MPPEKALAIDAMTRAQPDLVDRIFEYILSDPVLAEAIRTQAAVQNATIPKLKAAVRSEFVGERCYINGRPGTARQERVAQVLSLFDGRNATEVARSLGISRATVYRYLKQPRISNQSHVFLK